MSIHDGHRKRMKEEFLHRGLEGLPDHQALELLLFYSRLQGDVNPLSHILIREFGSLAGVLDATAEQLMAVPGVGENTAILLKLVTALGNRYHLARADLGEIINTSREVWELFSPYFFGARNEMIYLACLDAKHKLLGIRKLGEGIVNAAEITGRRVTEVALAMNSSVVILAHNHTSGIATPSREDVATTRYLHELLGRVSVELWDHVILVEGDMVSLRESGMMGG